MFNVSPPMPRGSTTTAAVPMGSCAIVPNPKTRDGMRLYNSQVASRFAVVPPIGVSPAPRMLSQSGGRLPSRSAAVTSLWPATPTARLTAARSAVAVAPPVAAPTAAAARAVARQEDPVVRSHRPGEPRGQAGDPVHQWGQGRGGTAGLAIPQPRAEPLITQRGPA